MAEGHPIPLAHALPEDRLTLREFFDQYFLPARLAGSSRESVKAYRKSLRQLSGYFGGEAAPEAAPEELSEKRLIDFKAWLGESGCSETTAEKYYGHVRAVWRAWKRHGLTPPRRETKRPAPPRLFCRDCEGALRREEDHLFRLNTDRVRSTRLTLQRAYESYLLPELRRQRRAPNTLVGYETALKRWSQHAVRPELLVSEITDTELMAFADRLLAWHRSRGESGWENCRKTLACIGAILRELTRPHGSEQPVLAYAPRVAPPAPPDDHDPTETRRRISRSEYSAAYRACEAADWPRQRHAEPADLWRCVLVLGATYGPRRWDLLDLAASAVHLAPECPHPQHQQKVFSPHGWLVFQPTKTRRRKRQKLYLPLTAVAAAHLRRIIGPETRESLFGFGRATKAIYRTWHRIWDAAGVGTRYEFRELRYSCSCDWNDLYPALGEHVTGHAPRGVNAAHYDQALERLVRFAGEMPQPDAFAAGAGLEHQQEHQQAEPVDWRRKLTSLPLSDRDQRILLELAESLAVRSDDLPAFSRGA